MSRLSANMRRRQIEKDSDSSRGGWCILVRETVQVGKPAEFSSGRAESECLGRGRHSSLALRREMRVGDGDVGPQHRVREDGFRVGEITTGQKKGNPAPPEHIGPEDTRTRLGKSSAAWYLTNQRQQKPQRGQSLTSPPTGKETDPNQGAGEGWPVLT